MESCTYNSNQTKDTFYHNERDISRRRLLHLNSILLLVLMTTTYALLCLLCFGLLNSLALLGFVPWPQRHRGSGPNGRSISFLSVGSKGIRTLVIPPAPLSV